MEQRQSYDTLVLRASAEIDELMPWDLEAELAGEPGLFLLDIREADEFAAAQIKGSVNVPRGLLEGACEYGFVETVPELVEARSRNIVVICRSGRRSALAASTMKELGYTRVKSLKLGVKGWNDSDFPLVDDYGTSVDTDYAEELLTPEISEEQLGLSG